MESMQRVKENCLFLVILVGLMLPGRSQGAGLDAYDKCKNEYDHASLYRFGELLASGWNLFVTDSKARSGDREGLPKTRAFIFFVSLANLTQQAKKQNAKSESPLDGGELETVFSCWNGYYSAAEKRAWSSVHSGFVDYLQPQWKKYFFPLPER